MLAKNMLAKNALAKNGRWLIRTALVALLILVVAVGAFSIWASTPLGPEEAALAALRSGAGVRVEDEPWLTFSPAGSNPTSGLILYPGGRVDARSYAPLARDIAAAGHLVVIVPMPLNLAVFAPQRAGPVITAHPEVDVWVIGGHSLGGAMAARYVYEHPGVVKGLVLWAAFPASGDDLSAREALSALSIYGTRDGLLTEEERRASQAILPPATCWVAIEGGNHAQFGAYGSQARDRPAAIPAAEQQMRVVDATTAFLDLLARSSDAPLRDCTMVGGTP